MPSGVLQRSQRLATGQDNRPIEALIPRHDATPQQNLGYKKKRRGFVPAARCRRAQRTYRSREFVLDLLVLDVFDG